MRTPSASPTGATGTLHLRQGRLGAGRPTDRARDCDVSGQGTSSSCSRAVASLRLGTGAARRGERGAEPARGRASSFSSVTRRRETSAIVAGPTTRWVAPVCWSAGSTRRGAWATARSNPLPAQPGSRPMRCTCSATSRPIPTVRRRERRGPLPPGAGACRAARHAPARRPLPPRPRQALPAHGQARAGRASTSPPRRRCTARWTCASGSMRPRRNWPRSGEACQRRSRGRTERPQRASGTELTELS